MKTINELQPCSKKYVSPGEIVKIEALENYSRLIDIHGKAFVFARTLGKYESALELPFFRVNRSVIINLLFVKYANEQIELKDGTFISISRRRKDKVLKALQLIQ